MMIAIASCLRVGVMNSFYVETEGDVTVHVFTDSSNQAVDMWVAELACHIEMTPPELPFRVLLDVSAKQVSFTLYARQKSLYVFSQYQQRHGRIAFLLSAKVAPYYARIFFAALGKIAFERAYFSDRAKALAWLREI
jgi:hypothetical protein